MMMYSYTLYGYSLMLHHCVAGTDYIICTQLIEGFA